MFKINWKSPIVNVKHFIDHYIKVLPDFKKLHISNLKNHFAWDKESSDKGQAKLFSRKMISLQGQLNEEIEDCIDSVAKLAPLVP